MAGKTERAHGMTEARVAQLKSASTNPLGPQTLSTIMTQQQFGTVLPAAGRPVTNLTSHARGQKPNVITIL